MDINIKQGDCLELMKEIPDKSIDMILCDLPYGTTHNKWDTALPFDKLWKQYKRIIKDHGTIALFGDGMFIADIMQSNKKWWRYNLVWNKVLPSGFLNANKMPLRSHEEIIIFYNKLPTYHPQKTVGAPNHSKGTPKECINNNYNTFKFKQTNDSNLKHPKSILTFSKPHPSISQHPTQKPVTLLEWLIKSYTNESETVLDNCMGSGSTGVACINTNRNFIGYELDEKYFEIAQRRINECLL